MGQASRLRVLFMGVQLSESERTSLSYPDPSEQPEPEPEELALPPRTSTFGPLCASSSDAVSDYGIKTLLFICVY
jgi:hypothetical protein